MYIYIYIYIYNTYIHTYIHTWITSINSMYLGCVYSYIGRERPGSARRAAAAPSAACSPSGGDKLICHDLALFSEMFA